MKKLIIGAVILLVVFGILFILVGVYTDRIIDPYVRSLLNESKPMNHRVEYKRIKVNLFKSIIKITDVRIYPDSSLLKDQNTWMEINVSSIKLTDFHIKNMLLHKILKVGDLVMLNPAVKIYLPLQPPEEIIEDIHEEKPEVTKAPLLNNISLERMLMSGGSFQLIHNDVIIASSTNISFIAEKINLVRNSRNEPIGYTYGDVKVHLANIIINAETGLYDMSLDSFTAHKLDSSIVMKGFRMIPRYDKKEFSGKLDFQNDRFDIIIGKISLKNIGFMRVLDGQPLNIAAVIIDSLDADIYRDKNVAFNVNRFPPFYNESFMKIRLPVLIDTVMVTNSRIKYGELAEGRTTAGEITLNDFSLSTYGLTNQPADSAEVNEMRLFVNAKVMGEGNLNAEVVLPLEGNMHDFSCSGSVGAMKLSPLNGMTEPQMNMTFEEGLLNRMTFSFSANDNSSRGWMEFIYSGLNVRLLRKDPGKEWGFVSFLANKMTNSNNPSPGQDLKTVEIGYERDKNKGIINYVWKTIQSGMVRTILPTTKYVIKHKPQEKATKKETKGKTEGKSGKKEKKEK